MNFFPPFAIVISFVFIFVTICSPAGGGCGSVTTYTKLADGHVTYGVDDGGCYLCDVDDAQDLQEHCRDICDSDPQCLSFSVARSPSFPGQMYQYESKANCCLERRTYPKGAYVDASADNDNPNNCQTAAKCWTRYEKNVPKHCRKSISSSPLMPDRSQVGSGKCTEVWPAVTYTDDGIKEKMDFISEGCPWDDPKLELILAQGYSQCKAEIAAEPRSISSVYTGVRAGRGSRIEVL